jgi:peroxiredoxin/predicted 2-oxoglutarate/Fe(II)-dependent dioxygenase YbiX
VSADTSAQPAQRVRPPLTVGEFAPWFVAPCSDRPNYTFNSVAGRYVVLSFYGSAADEAGKKFVDLMHAADIFDDKQACFFGVSLDPRDEGEGRVSQRIPGLRYFRDFDGGISKLYGVLANGRLQRVTFVLDMALRVHTVLPFDSSAQAHAEAVLSTLRGALAAETNNSSFAPVLVLPDVFSKDLCQRLIAHYEAGGAEDSGFMREVNGKTVGIIDHRHKSRSDKQIEDEALKNECQARIRKCVVPAIARAYNFAATRIERHIVACYDSAASGHFAAHRDNTTKGTAHRRFAVSVILNTGEFEGGHLRFPEYGPRTYSPPAGGAVVFSCSLLHEATYITAGKRYAYLPFLYDDEAAEIRQKNQVYLA